MTQTVSRYAATSFVIGNQAYVGSGYTNANVRRLDWWRYDPISDDWTEVSGMNTSRFSACSFSINGKGYCGLGGSSSGSLNDLQEYDPISDTWTAKSSLPLPGRYGSASFSIDGKGYICFGNTGSASGPFSSLLYEYDPSTDSWMQKTSCPGNMRYGARAFVLNQKAYLFGGTISLGLQSNDLWEYDPITDTWTQKSSIPGPIRDYPIGFVLNNLGIIGTGFNNSNVLNDFYGYDPTTDTWITIPAIPGTNQQRWAATAFNIGSRGFVATGNTSYSTNLKDDLWELVLLTGISDLSQFSSYEFNISEIPSANAILIHTTFPSPQLLTAEILSIDGKLIQTFRLTGETTKATIEDISKGVYIVRFVTDNNTRTGISKMVLTGK
ncbi:MAG TPA: kelch repeat-containing protein [Bacteroidia bacterium]|nr:kelch repeat-containing protein [Bacteroidia bacterium]